MSAEQFKNDEPVANQLRFEIQVCGEPAINSASAKVGSPHEIKIDESHRVLNPSPFGEGYTFYFALIVSLLATTCGIVWFLYQSALPVDLTSLSGLSENRDFSPKAISSSLEQNSNSARMPDPQKSDRLQIHDTTVGEIARKAI